MADRTQLRDEEDDLEKCLSVDFIVVVLARLASCGVRPNWD